MSTVEIRGIKHVILLYANFQNKIIGPGAPSEI